MFAKQLIDVLPKIFNFQGCGVTFVDTKSQDLFSINFLTKDQIKAGLKDPDIAQLNQIKDFDSVVKYPQDTGCTGQAIATRKAVFFNKDSKSNFFVGDIDNISTISSVESLIVCPIYMDDQLLGTI